ncbi:MAG TPA: hypothetical protein PLZ57_00630 [Pseudobdellovibrionaceae bacterium]|nr:hypothetical protein [Pseudobdellovibrionaceae bacterium]
MTLKLARELFVAVGALVAVTGSAQAADFATLVNEAKVAYEARGYDAAGRLQAERAVDLYKQAMAVASNDAEKFTSMIGQSEAQYFVGNSTDDNQVKIERHLAGLEIADAVVKAFGVQDVTAVAEADLQRLKALPADQLALLGEALYYRGINLGQWGAANGVMASLGRWPELRSTMELIVNINLKNIHEYGAFRTLGRGYFKVPGMFGGSNKRAEKYLSEAVKQTLAAGQIFSTNGYNNIYYAELLKDLGRDQEAKDLLQAFVNSQVLAVNPPSKQEYVRAQGEAADLLAQW